MNFFDFLKRQKQEDRQAFIVHYPALTGKTRFARRVAELDPSIYNLDFLESIQKLNLIDMDEIEGKNFQSFLLKNDYPAGTSTVIVDDLDFLLNTWDSTQKIDFVQWLRTSLRTPGVTDKTFIFFLQTDGVISQQELKNSHGESRIVELNYFDAIF